jgi:hypothetical protein
MDISFTSEKREDTVREANFLPQVTGVLELIYGQLDHIPVPATLVSGSSILQGCLPLLMKELSAEALQQRVGHKKCEQLRNLYHQSNLLNLWYSWEVKCVLETITKADIAVMVLKGADVATTLYRHPELRHFGDVDLMVRPEDLTVTIALLEGLGYHYHQEYRFESLSRQRAAFVYVKEVAVGYLVFEIHTSPHNNEMGVSFHAAQLWERARPITIEGVNVYGMGLEDLLLYLCWHFRSHSFSRLIWLYDITMLLLRYADQIDWSKAHTIAKKQGLVSTVYYCVLWCREVFHITLPEYAQIERFAPPALIRRLITHFAGDDLTALLYIDAGGERKLFQRLMVDDERALCLVMIRAGFPSPAHLGRLYMEHSRLPVCLFWLYYPLHPLFMLRVYFSNRYRRKKLTQTKARLV